MGEPSALLLIIFLRYEQLIDIDALQQYTQEPNAYTVVAALELSQVPSLCHHAVWEGACELSETLGLPAAHTEQPSNPVQSD